jgi:hypothetical protein
VSLYLAVFTTKENTLVSVMDLEELQINAVFSFGALLVILNN